MSDALHAHVLYRSRSVTISDVFCRPHLRECGAEEISRANHIVFPRSGVFVKRIGKEEIVADPNHVLFFRKNEPYRVAHPVGDGDECMVLAFASELLTEAVATYQPRLVDSPEQPFEFTHALSEQPVFFSQHRLRQQALSGQQDALTLDELAVEVLASVTRSAYMPRGFTSESGRSETRRIHREQAHRACLFLSAQYAEELSLAGIAAAVFTSTFHLARLFKRATGLSLHQYRNRLRLRAALDRIVAGERDLTNLALELGFSSHSHLTDMFHRAFGLSPSECRRSASSWKQAQMSKNMEVPGPRLL
jgi:AraC family transcriptional regulator